MKGLTAILCEDGATEAFGASPLPVEKGRLVCVALDEVIGGIIESPVAARWRGPVLWKALLLRAMVVRDRAACDGDAVMRLGVLGRTLGNAEAVGVVGLSECDERCSGCEADRRLARMEKAMAVLENKLDVLLSRVGGGTSATGLDGDGTNLVSSVGNVGRMVGRALRETERLRADNAYKAQVIDEMAGGADRFLAGVVAEIETQLERDLFFALIARKNVGGRQRVLSFTEIGKKLGGITKQAAHTRAKEFSRKYREPWQYVESIRRPERATNFSELQPSVRRKSGIDESYNYDAQ